MGTESEVSVRRPERTALGGPKSRVVRLWARAQAGAGTPPGQSEEQQGPTEVERVRRAEEKGQSPPVSRILCSARIAPRAVAIIPLGRCSRIGSGHLPAASPSRVSGCLFGVAPRRDCPFHPN
jgi:hypothetical protein